MKRRLQERALLMLCTLLLASTPFLAEAQTDRKDLMREASIIFAGTVSGVQSSSLTEIPASAQTMVVRVDQVLRKPAAVMLAAGDAVTMYVKDAATFQVGVQATFYTNGVIFGKGLVVKEVGHERLSSRMGDATMSDYQAEIKRLDAELGDEALRARIETADVVVVGQVEEVRLPQTMALRAKPSRISEHDPMWREAVIKVESGIKGAQTGDKIVVRFSASEDVAWFRTPKLQIGQSGTFILPKDTVSGAPRALLAGAEVEAYTVLKPANLLPATEAARVRELMRQ